MKAVLFALSALILNLTPEAQSSPLISLRSDKASYGENERAVLRASLATRPADPNYEFDVVSTLNAAPIAMERTTDFEQFASTAELSVGSYTWSATLVLQDKRYARDLKNSIGYFDGRIALIDEDLANATDPEEIEQLERSRARYVSLKASAEAELANHRATVAGPITHEFTVL